MGRVLNKVAIITGAASGLGKADAYRLAEEGAELVLTDINVQEGKRVAGECKGNAIFFEQDVSSESSWPVLMETTIAEFGRLDILVNNAGIAHIANIENTSTDQWNEILRVCLDGTFFGCRSAIPEMAKSGGGSIINMSSTTALVGLSPYLAYSAAKASINNLSQNLASEWAKKNVRVNALRPGFFPSRMSLPSLGSSHMPQSTIPLRSAADSSGVHAMSQMCSTMSTLGLLGSQ